MTSFDEKEEIICAMKTAADKKILSKKLSIDTFIDCNFNK